MAIRREIVPFGRGWTEFVDQRFPPGLPGWAERRPPRQITRPLHHPRKITPGIDLVLPGNQVEDVTAVARRPIGPQPRLVARQHHLEAVARTAQHIPDEELAFAHLAGRIERGQNTLQPADQIGPYRIAFAVRIGWGAAIALVEIDHAQTAQHRFAHAQYLHS